MKKALIIVLAVLLCAALFVSCKQDQPTIHVVVFNSNGGLGYMEAQKTSEDSIKLDTNRFYMKGYSFAGWSLSPSGLVFCRDGETISIASDLYLFALWVPNTYTVKFDANGGTGTMADETFAYHESKALTENSFKGPDDKFFVNWKVKDSDTYYMDGEKVGDLTPEDKAVITLEAQWGKGFDYRKKVLVWQKSITTYEYLECAVDKSKVTLLDKDSKVTELNNGWFAVAENLTVKDRIEIKGDVYLILCDGATFTAEKGINVENGNRITIYDQKGGTGKLVVSNPDIWQSGIGGGSEESPSGEITIHGGVLEINGGESGGAAIGGSDNATNGKILIYGGNITANGRGYSSAIGSGDHGDAGVIEIYGGNIVAKAKLGAGIGAGVYGHNGTIIIAGDAVIDAEGGIPLSTEGEAAAGIGGASDHSGGRIYIFGGTITAKGGIRPESDYWPKITGAGIGCGNIGNKGLYGTLEYASNIKIEVSSDGKKWEDFKGDEKQYMRTSVIN